MLITHTQARAGPVPCLQTIRTTLAQLLRYLTWKYPSFQWGDYEATGITLFLNGACLSNRLLRGIQSEQIWVGARLARLMSTAWIESHLTDGSPSWDVTMRKLLSFVLISSTAARPGDLSPRQRYWPGLALRYRDILIYFDEERSGLPKLTFARESQHGCPTSLHQGSEAQRRQAKIALLSYYD